MREFEASRIRVDAHTGRVTIDDESVSWFQGVLGERRVADRLSRLGDDFTVIHSVPFRKREGDIDHVVIGPADVTIINTKHSPGRRVWSAGYGIYVGNREEKGFIRDLVQAARETERRLAAVVGMTVPVRGVLCFVDPDGITRRAAAGGGEFDAPVEVVSDRELSHVLHRRRELSDDQITRITAAAVLPETWHDSPRPSTVGAHIALEFDALEREIGADVERRLAEREAERTAANAARRQARASSARRPEPAASGSRYPAASSRQSIREPQRERIPAPRSRGVTLLGLWPMLVALLFVFSSVAGILVSRGTFGVNVFDGLSIVWLLALAMPVVLALADRMQLRQHRVLDGRVLLPWILLGPLVYLIARAVELRRAGRAAGTSVALHLGAAVGGGVLACVIVAGAALLLVR